MKKTFAIVLIAILILNVMGYYSIFLGIQYQHHISMTARLDANLYDKSQTITLTLPIAVPYRSNHTDFERVDGLFEHNGEFYRLVKQKYANDTLTIICLKDPENKQIQQALTNYVKTFSDGALADNHHHAKHIISFIKDYLPQIFSITPLTPGWHTTVFHNTTLQQITPSYTSLIIHPPEPA